MQYDDIIIAIDPGLTGAIAIFDKTNISIYKIPVKTTIINKKNKNIYDTDEIINIFSNYRKKSVFLAIERQSSRPGEGSVSSFTNGANYGLLKGIGLGLGFNLEIIGSITWKKVFSEFNNPESMKLKITQKEKRQEIKDNKEKKQEIKNIKDKKLKKEYIKRNEEIDKIIEDIDKEIKKIGRQIKKNGKDKAREIAQKLYPLLKQEFIKVGDDGKADAILLGTYVKEYLKKES